jgi:hypothetical protein
VLNILHSVTVIKLYIRIYFSTVYGSDNSVNVLMGTI